MKKTNKENPLSFFRKANETRQKNVRASIKKAQDGIEMNDDLINKSGSTGGYKKTPEKWWLSDTTKMLNESAKFNVDTINNIRSSQGPQAMPSRSSAIQRDTPKQVLDKALRDSYTNRPKSNTPIMDSLFEKKKGGAVKRKK